MNEKLINFPTHPPDTQIPTWVTSWPDWFGLQGNVEVMPTSMHTRVAEQLDEARAALADIALSDDMTLDVARRKALRAYRAAATTGPAP